MSHTSRPSPRGLAAAAVLAVGVSGLTAVTAAPALANPAGTGLVISEVYGGGGNSGATFTNDFIELYNPTAAAISVDGSSVQYRSATGTTAQVTNLAGSVPAGGHYLVQEAAGTSVTDKPLPAPDATGTISMSGTNGVVLLVPSTTGFTAQGDLAGNPGVTDMVGYGGTPTSYETANTGTALTNSTSASRVASGADTDDNAADFTAGAPSPQNSGGVAPPPPQEFSGSIAEIQGTDTDTTPHAGETVTTTGVVTAAYPTGGFNGFFLQTEGTGGGTDATPGASDAIFVYGSAATATVAVGDYVQVVGTAKEFGGETEIETDSADDVTPLTGSFSPPQALVTDYPTSDAAREAHEGELLDVSGQRFTVTNNYSTNQYAEIGLATGDTPLVAPTETIDAQDTAAIAAATAANAARAVTLDHGASINFLPFDGGDNQDIALPWLSPTNTVRVSSAATFHEPVILDYRNSTWKFQPTHRVTDEGTDVATFTDTRAENLAPQDVGGDLRLATFNVLNYFPTTGEEFVADGGTCTFYVDRDDDPVTDNRCDPNGPRGAAEAEDLKRQQDKIVTAINTLDADVVSLEEIENSVKFGKDRDSAVSTLVDALNADAGSTRWAFAPSPAPADLPPTAEQDVIRTAFIYNPQTVDLVGASEVLVGSAPFTDAREPLAQAFKPHGAPDGTAFGVIVNHFKSKGSGVDDHTGQGNANPDRVAQAEALATFADGFKADRGISELFLSGDFNAYSMEDPVQALESHGYTNLHSDQADEYTYNFSGMDGSLDHVFANEAALAAVTGVDIWNINADESVAFEYSRDNYNATDFYQANQFRASDHDPEIVGIDVPGFPAEPAASAVTATAGKVTYGNGGRITITVASDNDASGTVQVREGERLLGQATLTDGTATVTLGKHALRPGRHQLTVSYSGDEDVAASSTQLTVVVGSAMAGGTVTDSSGH